MATVLVIEDDRFNRLLYRDLLEGEGWGVVLAPDGASGLAAAHESGPGVILVDIQLPDMSGLDLTRTLKEGQSTGKIPIIVVSAHALEKHRAAAAAAGADAFIKKPFEFAALVATVRRHLSERGAS